MDFVTDNSGRHLAPLLEVDNLPEYVKSATLADEDIALLPVSAFADPAHREFPIDNKGHTFLSLAYVKSAGVNNKALIFNLERAAKLHGIEGDLPILEQVYAQNSKSAAAKTENFAVLIDFGQATPGTKSAAHTGVVGFYPINDENQTIGSARKLAEDWGNRTVPMEVFVAGSRSIYKQACNLGVRRGDIPKIVLDYGQSRLPDFEFIKEQAAQRVQITDDNVYQEIALTAESNPKDDMLKLADLWHMADGVNNVKTTKSGTLDAYRIFNSGPTKDAYEAELNQWVPIAESPVPVQSLASLKLASVVKFFTPEATERVMQVIKAAGTKSGGDLDLEVAGLTPAEQRALLRALVDA